jgi:hypothetical protein
MSQTEEGEMDDIYVAGGVELPDEYKIGLDLPSNFGELPQLDQHLLMLLALHGDKLGLGIQKEGVASMSVNSKRMLIGQINESLGIKK